MKTFLRLVCSIVVGILLALLMFISPFGPWLPFWAKVMTAIIAVVAVPICLFNDDEFKKLFE